MIVVLAAQWSWNNILFKQGKNNIQGTKRSHRYICLDGHPSTLALTPATSSECTWLKQINASSRTLEVDTKFTEVESTSLLGPSHCDESAMVCHEPLKSRTSHDILRHSYLRNNCSGWKKKKKSNNNNFINPIFQFTTKHVFAANTHTHTLAGHAHANGRTPATQWPKPAIQWPNWIDLLTPCAICHTSIGSIVKWNSSSRIHQSCNGRAT